MVVQKLNGEAKALWGYARDILALIVVPLLVWSFNVSLDLATIKANRFTSADGVKLMEQMNSISSRQQVLMEQIRQLEKQIEEIKHTKSGK